MSVPVDPLYAVPNPNNQSATIEITKGIFLLYSFGRFLCIFYVCQVNKIAKIIVLQIIYEAPCNRSNQDEYCIDKSFEEIERDIKSGRLRIVDIDELVIPMDGGQFGSIREYILEKGITLGLC